MKYRFFFSLVLLLGSLASISAKDNLDLKTNSEDEVKPDERSRELKLKQSQAEKNADNIFKKYGFSNKKDQSHQKKLQELIEKDKERIKKFFGNDYQKFFNGILGGDMGSFDFDKMEDIEKEMMKNMQKFFDQAPSLKGLGQGFNSSKKFSYEWKDFSDKKILILKLNLEKDQPIDINIKDSTVILKAKLTSTNKTNNSFSQSTSIINERVSIPSELDPDKAKFENIKGNIHISFPKKSSK